MTPAVSSPPRPGAVGLATAAEAFAAIALSAITCDGELTAVEARALRQQLEFRHPFRGLGPDAMAALLDQLLSLLRSDGWPALVQQAVPLLSAEQRQTALAVAVQLTLADEVKTSDERRFLTQLSHHLGISAERLATIEEVIGLLHRDSLAD
ncbi:MAG: tellurite resistance TerB family protein [Vulcanococcus sp.]